VSGAGRGREIIVRPLGNTAIALGPRETTGWAAVPEVVAVVARELLGLKPGTSIGEHVYALSPESKRRLVSDRTMQVGEYFRGTLLDHDGKFSHSLQLREVDSAGVTVSNANFAMAAQVAALQAEIEALRDLAEQIAADVRAVLEFLRIEQSAEVSAAVNTVNEVFEAVIRRGVVGHVDWARVVGLEQILRKQATQVEQELEGIRDRLDFNGHVSHDFKITREVQPERVEALLKMTLILEKALEQQAWLQLAHKGEVAEFDEVAAEQLLRSLDKARKRRRSLAKAIRKAASTAPQVEGRPWLERLFKDGIVVGGQRDNDRSERVRALQSAIASQSILKRAAVTPPPAVRLQIEGPAG
jgi:hypothetical protein